MSLRVTDDFPLVVEDASNSPIQALLHKTSQVSSVIVMGSLRPEDDP